MPRDRFIKTLNKTLALLLVTIMGYGRSLRGHLTITLWPWLFSAAIIFSQTLSSLPSIGWPLAVLVSAIAIPSLGPARWALIPISIGFAWSIGVSQSLVSQEIQANLIRKDIAIGGWISGIPNRDEHKVRFNFEINTVNGEANLGQLPKRLRLSWYERPPPELQSGEYWQMTVRLKPAHGSLNPGGFDYSAYLFANRIRATGYVRIKNPREHIPDKDKFRPINQLRHRFDAFSSQQVGDHSALLSALSVGLRNRMSDQQWLTLQNTGTTHLMAISGLHIGLVAALFYGITGFIWRHTLLTRTLYPSQKVSALGALAAGFIYAALAGFSLPTTRALWMLIATTVWLLSGINSSKWFGFGLVLATVLVIDSLASLSAGFWLSFLAVAIILYSYRQPATETKSPPALPITRRFWRKTQLILSRYSLIQVALFIGLAPVLLIFFQKLSIASLVANAIAIPIIGLIIVPLALLSLALFAFGASTFSGFILGIANGVFETIWQLLDWLGGQPWAILEMGAPPWWVRILAALATLVLFYPKPLRLRWLALVLLPLALIIKPERPADGSFWLTLLDVGQGLSAIVQTAHHTLVYDVGPKSEGGFDAGSSIVAPFLRHQGITTIDTLVISHGNQDHIGGLNSVLSQFPTTNRFTSITERVANSTSCVSGMRWQWDQVSFEILHPTDTDRFSGNDASCVLLIKSDFGQALLTADIEASAESVLIKRHLASTLRSDVILVPHQGSKTSSSPAFIEATQPQLALINAGYLNHFGHPHPAVTKRYQQRSIPLLNTASEGAIHLHFNPTGIQIKTERRNRERYWRPAPETTLTAALTPYVRR